MTRVAINGVCYNVERTGDGPPVVLIHGFTGSVRTWESLIPALAHEFETIAIDLLGHGDSDAPADASRYGPAWVVSDLTSLLDRLGVARAAWLGYSMGGRAALHVAVEHPEVVTALVLEGVSPGILDPDERAERVKSDATLADFIEAEGIASFVERWERLPLFASQSRLPEAIRAALRSQRLANDPTGLANSLRGFGQGAQVPLHDRLSKVRAPALLIVGEDDLKFQRLARDVAARLPHARVVVVPGAGHAVHVEQPAQFADLVRGFLQSARDADE